MSETKLHAAQEWMYFKLYLGPYTDRAEQMLVNLAQLVESRPVFARWFYIRYFDETGMHFRIRFQSADVPAARAAAQSIFAILFKDMAKYAPSEHRPMVTPPGTDPAQAASFMAKGKQRVVEDTYEPEYDKYGGPLGLPIAEELFRKSSRIAVAILADEAAGHYSRKTLVPCLMRACHEAFVPAPAAAFWNRYSLFWLGGDSPAANDWLQKFRRKGEELRHAGFQVCVPDRDLHPRALEVLNRWRAAVAEAKAAYDATQGRTGAIPDVLCFNFVHMMNNRLGMTSLEEPYMAALLQQSEMKEAA